MTSDTVHMDGLDTIAKGDGSRLVEARRFVARDTQAFAAIWAAHAGPDAPVPAIDFQTRMVAAVFAGERPTPGYDIEITGTRRDGDALVVVVEEHRPDPSVVAAQLLISPFHIVTLPRDDGAIKFDAYAPGVQPTIVFKPTVKRTRRPAASAPEATAAPVTESTDWTADGASSTGLTPRVAATMAYLAGPFSGALILATERTNVFVRFHAWQAVFGLGAIGTAAVLFLFLAFVMLIASPTAFWVMLWLAAITGVAWVVVWAVCLRTAYTGRRWKLPYAGDYAERFANS